MLGALILVLCLATTRSTVITTEEYTSFSIDDGTSDAIEKEFINGHPCPHNITQGQYFASIYQTGAAYTSYPYGWHEKQFAGAVQSCDAKGVFYAPKGVCNSTCVKEMNDLSCQKTCIDRSELYKHLDNMSIPPPNNVYKIEFIVTLFGPGPGSEFSEGKCFFQIWSGASTPGVWRGGKEYLMQDDYGTIALFNAQNSSTTTCISSGKLSVTFNGNSGNTYYVSILYLPSTTDSGFLTVNFYSDYQKYVFGKDCQTTGSCPSDLLASLSVTNCANFEQSSDHSIIKNGLYYPDRQSKGGAHVEFKNLQWYLVPTPKAPLAADDNSIPELSLPTANNNGNNGNNVNNNSLLVYTLVGVGTGIVVLVIVIVIVVVMKRNRSEEKI